MSRDLIEKRLLLHGATARAAARLPRPGSRIVQLSRAAVSRSCASCHPPTRQLLLQAVTGSAAAGEVNDFGPLETERAELVGEGEDKEDDEEGDDPLAEGGRQRDLTPPRLEAVVGVVPGEGASGCKIEGERINKKRCLTY